MLAGSASPDIESIYIKGISTVVCKGSDYNPNSRLDLSGGIRMRGKELILI